jgi:hypothetical protein
MKEKINKEIREYLTNSPFFTTYSLLTDFGANVPREGEQWQPSDAAIAFYKHLKELEKRDKQ